jgi:hypothetical protein
MNGAGGRATSKSRRRVAGGSGSTSPDEVLERPAAGPNGFGRRLTQGPTVVITRGTTYQNRANLAGA